jgi:hypothetical protein
LGGKPQTCSASLTPALQSCALLYPLYEGAALVTPPLRELVPKGLGAPFWWAAPVTYILS